MAEDFTISKKGTKREKYEALIPQIKALLDEESDLIANLANVTAALKYAMDFFWVGFYLVKNDELILGPFQGPVACTRIQKGKGVCGKAFLEGIPIIVPDVDQFPGHIACSTASKSEIVIPVTKDHQVTMVLDVDSDSLNQFDEVDLEYLSLISKLL